jgi:CBS domain-containing protein
MKKLKEVMSKNVKCVSPETGLREIARKMKELDIGSVPICENDRLVGIVTDRDIVMKTLANDLDPNKASAREVMTSPVVYCFEDHDIGEASRLMEVKQIRRLIVLTRDKKLAGIVSLGDLSVRGGSEELAGETLEKISEPAPHAVA